MRILVGGYRVLFSSLSLFLTFVPLFDVQIVSCPPGLAVVSKLEVSKPIRGSANERLLFWLKAENDELLNVVTPRR